MGTEYDGAMFTVSKREGGNCFIQQIYNTGDYVCYKTPSEDVSSKVVLTVGHDGAYFTRDIIVMGSVK